jgi:hypothetical protein
MVKIKLTLNEFISGFGKWVTDMNRVNPILYSVSNKNIIISFVFDYTFVCVISEKDLLEYYSNQMEIDNCINSFVQEYLTHFAIETEGVLKFIL